MSNPMRVVHLRRTVQTLLEIVARTDGRARRIMFEKFAAGTGGNQHDIVAEARLPIAVVNGRDE